MNRLPAVALSLGLGIAIPGCASTETATNIPDECFSQVIDNVHPNTSTAIDGMLRDEVPGEQSGKITAEAARVLMAQPIGAIVVGCISTSEKTITINVWDGHQLTNQGYTAKYNGTPSTNDVEIPPGFQNSLKRNNK